MTKADIKTMLDGLGVPTAYYQFPDGTDITPPFLVWFYPDSDNLFADNTVYGTIEQLHIELYSDEKDFELEGKLETILNDNSLPYHRSEVYVSGEQLFETIYTTEVYINER